MLTEVSVYGIIKPIVISKTNVVIDGNLRLQASRELKIGKVPVTEICFTPGTKFMALFGISYFY